MKNIRSRGWCLTLNNPTDSDMAYLCSLYHDDVSCTYLIIGQEKAPRTGTPHLQCYIYYKDQKSFTAMKKKLAKHHIEAEKSKLHVKAYCYCMKEYNYCEFGERPRQGNRSDLEVIKHDLLKKKDMVQVSKEYFSQWCQYRRSFDEFVRMHNRFDTQLIIYNDDSIEKIYKYDLKNSLVIETAYLYTPSDVLHKFYSRRYEYIFYPNNPMMDQRLQDVFTQII